MDSVITKEIGSKIRFFRKNRGLTIQELSDIIHKSKATVSKYETGEIALDVVTFYDIANALHITPDQLLYNIPVQIKTNNTDSVPAFFRNISRIYTYRFDGRTNSILRGILDISQNSDVNKYDARFYLNFRDYEDFQNCSNTYIGNAHFFNTLTRIELTNQDSPAELCIIHILNAFADSATKWGMVSSVSSHPLMPCSSKTLFSKKRMQENEELIKMVTLTKEDIKLMKTYNMFVVPG